MGTLAAGSGRAARRGYGIREAVGGPCSASLPSAVTAAEPRPKSRNGPWWFPSASGDRAQNSANLENGVAVPLSVRDGSGLYGGRSAASASLHRPAPLSSPRLHNLPVATRLASCRRLSPFSATAPGARPLRCSWPKTPITACGCGAPEPDRPELLDARENTRFLPGVPIPTSIEITGDLRPPCNARSVRRRRAHRLLARHAQAAGQQCCQMTRRSSAWPRASRTRHFSGPREILRRIDWRRTLGRAQRPEPRRGSQPRLADFGRRRQCATSIWRDGFRSISRPSDSAFTRTRTSSASKPAGPSRT